MLDYISIVGVKRHTHEWDNQERQLYRVNKIQNIARFVLIYPYDLTTNIRMHIDFCVIQFS